MFNTLRKPSETLREVLSAERYNYSSELINPLREAQTALYIDSCRGCSCKRVHCIAREIYSSADALLPCHKNRTFKSLLSPHGRGSELQEPNKQECFICYVRYYQRSPLHHIITISTTYHKLLTAQQLFSIICLDNVLHIIKHY